MKSNIYIEKMTLAHIDDICKVENESFAIPWSRRSFEDELNNSCATYFVALADNIAVGYIGIWNVSGEGDITNIAVLPGFRQNHIGSMLIETIILFCKENSISPITLEVRESNIPAISLYSKYGFKEIGFRKKYYADNGENAIIMSLE